MKKRIIAIAIAVVLVLAVLGTVLLVSYLRSRKAPPLDDALRARIEELVEASFEVNTLLFGKGLPVYPRVYEESFIHKITYEEKEYDLYWCPFPDETLGEVVAYQYYIRQLVESENGNSYAYIDLENGGAPLEKAPSYYRYAERSKEMREGYIYHSTKTGYYYYPLKDFEPSTFFYSDSDDPYYDYVKADCGYLTTADIKEKAETVYSAAYLRSVYESLFTGVTVSDRDEGTLYARYIDYKDENAQTYLMKSNLTEGYSLSERRYDYSTMAMTKDSRAKYITVEMDSYIVGDEQARIKVELSFSLEGGVWMLDTPSY